MAIRQNILNDRGKKTTYDHGAKIYVNSACDDLDDA
jgi:hypothetical protein